MNAPVTHIREILSSSRLQLFLVLLAVCLQTQVTLFETDTYAGLRLNVADFLLPFLGIFVLISISIKRSAFPRWPGKYIAPVLTLMLAAMSLALWYGHAQSGTWSGWALINKYCGFLILLSYFLLGSWITSNYSSAKPLEQFSRFFSYVFTVVLCVSLTAILLKTLSGLDWWIGRFPWDGLMANRNSFAVTAVVALLAIEMKSIPTPLWLSSLLWFLMPVFMLYNGSRAAWIACGLILITSFIKAPRLKLKRGIPFLIFGLVLAFLLQTNASHKLVREGAQLQNLVSLMHGDLGYQGDRKRLIALEDSLDLFRSSNPLIGAGLGQYESFQKEKRGAFIDIIDCSPLWLLTETGIFGLTSFSVFFLFCLFIFYRRGFGERRSTPHQVLFFFLILMIGMSLAHELLYTRFIWLLLGLGIASPIKAENNY